MEDMTAMQWAMAGSAAVACTACRRLKMRCIMQRPPCNRCAKANRECVVVPSRRGHQKPAKHSIPRRSAKAGKPKILEHDDSHAAPDRLRSGSAKSHWRQLSTGISASTSPSRSSRPRSDPSPPAGLSLPVRLHPSQFPADLLATLSSPEPTSSAELTPDQQRVILSEIRERDPLAKPHISDDALEDLLRFFCTRLIYFVPIIDHSDFNDVACIVKHRRPLAYCAGLVASNFMPGGATLRTQLIPLVADFLRTLEGSLDYDEATRWTHICAYAILYAYGPSTGMSNSSLESDGDRRLNHWILRSGIEMFALRLGVHRVFAEVKELIQSGVTEIWQTPAFKKYVFWLWLFTMSHHFSIVTETPPTIPQDYSIRVACSILSQIYIPPRIARMLAEVDLCMLWSLAGKSLPGLDEWWCPPRGDTDPEAAITVLQDADAALEVWSRRWGVHGEPDSTYPGLDLSSNGAVDFHFRATKFWMRVFATRIIHSSGLTLPTNVAQDTPLGQLNLELTLKSAEGAWRCCRYLFDIPQQKQDAARYMADFGFALLAFCAIHIIRIYEQFGNALPILNDYIKTVEDLGNLFVGMGVGSNQIPVVYGKRVLARLAEVKRPAILLVDPVLEVQSLGDVAIDLQWIDDIFQESYVTQNAW